MNIKNFFPHRTQQVTRMGFGISFAGSLPPGIITLGVLQASLAGGFWAGAAFSLGALAVEASVVWLTLVGTAWLMEQRRWFRVFEWLTLGLVAALVVGMAISLARPATASGGIFLPKGMPFFVAGMLLRLLTPTMIPFWLGWNSALFARDLLLPHAGQYRAYLAGIGLGTFAAHLIFILLSHAAADLLVDVQFYAKWLIFIALSVVLVQQVFKMKIFSGHGFWGLDAD